MSSAHLSLNAIPETDIYGSALERTYKTLHRLEPFVEDCSTADDVSLIVQQVFAPLLFAEMKTAFENLDAPAQDAGIPQVRFEVRQHASAFTYEIVFAIGRKNANQQYSFLVRTKGRPMFETVLPS